MKYPYYEQLNVRVRKEQKDWLYEEADKQEANVSAIVRQAIKMFIKKKNEGDKENAK